MTPAADRKRRPYNSTRRTQQAAQTRQAVVDAGIAVFGELGYGGTTMAALAERAGVAIETIYSGFGSKKGLLRAAMDAAVVGDVEPVPMVERPEWQALARGRTADRWKAVITLLTDIHERSAAVWRAILEAATSDAEVEAWRVELEAGRRLDSGRALERVLGRDVDDATADLVWAIWSPEVYLKLVTDRGFSRADYEAAMLRASMAITRSAAKA